MDLIKLLNSLTIEEKLGQMTMLPPYLFLESDAVKTGPLEELGLKENDLYMVGSILGIGSAKEMKELQRKYLEKSRHKIPLLFMADIIHGYQTIFPVPLALATSFNDKLVEKAAHISAIEAHTSGINVTFAPMADLTNDPRWGRIVETFGEDPYLIERLTKAKVKGFQGKDFKTPGNIASCVKHFAGYGAITTGKDYDSVDISRLNLFQKYLSGYKAAIDQKAKMVMTSFNIFEGIPATVNQYLIKEILRKKWKFDGVIISDYASLKETITHGTSKDEYDAAVKGVKASLDIEMATTLYFNNLKKALDNNDISIDLIDESVYRILKLKKELGLFDDPYKGANEELEKTLVRSNSHLKEALKVTEESIVLLKNNDLFPVINKKIALIGPFADNPYINGPWSWHGSKHLNDTLYKELNKVLNVEYVNDGQDVNWELVSKCDVILLALGEDERSSGEAKSRSSLKLPNNQDELIINASLYTNLPIGVVLFNGRPLNLTVADEFADGILEAFYPGSMGALALSNIITGKTNPSAKLTVSFPRSVGQIPIFYNHLNTGRPYLTGGEFESKYLDLPNTPLYPFGHGLSYSKFEYTNFILDKNTINKKDTLNASITITNNSNIPGKEIVQLYLKDHHFEVARPVLELINYQKISLKSFESKKINFKVKVNDLKYYNQNLKKVTETGKFTLYVGSNSSDLLSKDFILVEGS